MCEGSPEGGLIKLEATVKPEYQVYFEIHIPITQRSILAMTVIVLAMFSIIGNIATFVVAVRRDIRPVFRTCLISLALSDLVCTSSSTISFLGALLSAVPQLWNLGPTMCYIIPFLKIIGPLVNSLTLFAISFDRYLSMRCIMKRLWEPGGKWCFVIAVCVWGTSSAIAAPTIAAYYYYPAIIITTNGSANETHIMSEIPGYMCGTLKQSNAHYYAGIFFAAFFPIITAFIWMNTFLAVDVWKRRKGVPGSHKTASTQIQETSTESAQTPTNNESQKQIQEHFKQTCKIRKKRQLRTLYIVILLTISYLVLKLPEWVYILVMVYNRSDEPTSWLLRFVFGIISMASGVVNPLLYAFVTETIEHLQELNRSIQRLFGIFCQRSVQILSNVVIPPEPTSDMDNISDQCRENDFRNSVV